MLCARVHCPRFSRDPDVTLMYFTMHGPQDSEVDIAAFQLSISFLDSQHETNRSYLSNVFFPFLLFSVTVSTIAGGPFPYLYTTIDALSAPECVRIQQSSKGYTMIAMLQTWDLVCARIWPHTQLALFILQLRNLTHCFDSSASDSLFFFFLFVWTNIIVSCRSGSEPAEPEGFNSANSQLT